MIDKIIEKKNLIKITVITLFLMYGVHYFGYFIRVRYFSLIEPLAQTNPPVHAILRYLGHLIFWIVFAIYALVVKEDRKYFKLFSSKHKNNKLRYLLLGMIVGFAMNAACVLAANWHGDITIGKMNNVNIGLFVAALIAVLIQASQEELESRAFVFRKLEDGGVSFSSSVVIAGMYFSYLHAANPGFGLKPFISLALAGTVYLLLYVVTGSIWAACGIHQLWNVTQDFIFGLPNSGNPSSMSIFSSKANSSSFFYDMEFGVEGSFFCIILHIIVIVILVLIIKKKECIKEKRELP